MPEAAQDSFKMVIMKMKAASMPSIADVRELLLRRKYVAGDLFLLVAIASCSAAQIY